MKLRCLQIMGGETVHYLTIEASLLIISSLPASWRAATRQRTRLWSTLCDVADCGFRSFTIQSAAVAVHSCHGRGRHDHFVKDNRGGFDGNTTVTSRTDSIAELLQADASLSLRYAAVGFGEHDYWTK